MDHISSGSGYSIYGETIITKVTITRFIAEKFEMHESIRSIPLRAYYCIIEKKSASLKELLFLQKACNGIMGNDKSIPEYNAAIF